MTDTNDFDSVIKNTPLPFDHGEAVKMGIRVRPAEFARIMGCTKQAVSVWVRDGKITLGTDGRVDPRQAVAQLLRTSDPARLRAIVLRPLVIEANTLRHRCESLENTISSQKEEIEFLEGVTGELHESWDYLCHQIKAEWITLRTMPPDVAVAAFDAWTDAIMKMTAKHAGEICDYLPATDGASGIHEGDAGL